ncbi:group I truncated hemoglobin [Neptuniibacter sp. PT8_73]|uniref:group I truncated hemoglobin n=1 Tax=unclassified Neptuniibacter TaxID=2630693 RepID=UPI0039F658F9
MSEISLYQRLGGEEKIKAIATSIFDNHTQNTAVSARYKDSDRDGVIKVVTEFICSGTGGPQEYTGKNMLDAHRGMNISATEYLAVVDDIMNALESNDVGDQEKMEVLMIAYSLKGEIMHV